MAVGVEAVAGMAGAVEAVDFTAGAVVVAGMAEAVGLLGFTAGAVVVAGMAEAVGTMDLLPMVVGPTWVMGRAVTAFRLAACMHTDLLLTA
jgi:formylmethanofuran dehydrogenase subunit C